MQLTASLSRLEPAPLDSRIGKVALKGRNECIRLTKLPIDAGNFSRVFIDKFGFGRYHAVIVLPGLRCALDPRAIQLAELDFGAEVWDVRFHP